MSARTVMVIAGLVGLLCLISEASRTIQGDETKEVAAPQKELDALWSDLYADDPTAATAVIKFYKHADTAVAYLGEKLKPLILEEDHCVELLEKLGSDDEEVWKQAWEELDYLDPRLAIDLQTLMNEITDVPARTRMVALLSDREADSMEGRSVSIRSVGSGFNFFDGRGSWWAEHLVDRIGTRPTRPKKAWTRAARGIAILEQIGTPAAVKVLEQIASGHPDAFPTKAAQDSIERLKK